MKYAIAAAAVVGLAAAAPGGNDWESWSSTTTATTTSEWESWTTSTTKSVEYTSTTTAEWTTWKAPEPTCYSTKTYTTKDSEGKADEWGNYADVVKTTTIYDDKYCSTWEPYYASTTSTWASWEPAKCSTVTVYVTKDSEGKKDEWGNYSDVTKTKTIYDDKYCPTSSTWAYASIKTPAYETSTYTWASASIKTPAAESSAYTWASASIKATSSVAAPVAKYTGAANQQAVGMGALAIAAVAALL